jgi:hypothetical protein
MRQGHHERGGSMNYPWLFFGYAVGLVVVVLYFTVGRRSR